jgi:hypothetical protein
VISLFKSAARQPTSRHEVTIPNNSKLFFTFASPCPACSFHFPDHNNCSK